MAEQRVEQIHFIEDSDDEVFLARLLLGSQGLHIDIVHHTCLADLLSTLVDTDDTPAMLVFVDLNMPGMRGDAVIQTIRSHAQFNGSIVGICTGSEDPADRKASLEAGAQFFVQKPLDVSALKKISVNEPRLKLRTNSDSHLEIWIDIGGDHAT